MTDEDRPQIDLNESSAKELAQLPGVGETLARRIVTGRPYQDVTDLQRLEGLGKRKIDQLIPYLTVGGAEDEDESVEEQSRDLEPVGDRPGPAPSRNLVWIAIGVVVAVLASLILNLAILATINGGLRYSRRTTEQVIVQDLQTFEQDLTQLERRMRAAEHESERLSNLTERLDGAAERLEAVGSDLDQIGSDLDELQARVQITEEQAARSQMFLEGLQSLLEGLLMQPDLDRDAGGLSP